MTDRMVSVSETMIRKVISVLESHPVDDHSVLLLSLRDSLPAEDTSKMNLKGIFSILDQEKCSDEQAAAAIAWLLNPNNGLDNRLAHRVSEKIKRKM